MPNVGNITVGIGADLANLRTGLNQAKKLLRDFHDQLGKSSQAAAAFKSTVTALKSVETATASATAKLSGLSGAIGKVSTAQATQTRSVKALDAALVKYNTDVKLAGTATTQFGREQALLNGQLSTTQRSLATAGAAATTMATNTRAVTTGVSNSRRELTAFNSAAANTSKAATGFKNTTASVIRMERALARGKEGLLNLSQAVRNSSNTQDRQRKIIADLNGAYQRYSRSIKGAANDQLAFARATQRLNSRFALTRRGLRQTAVDARVLSGGTTKLIASTNNLSTAMTNLSTAGVLAVGPLSGIGARLVAIGTLAKNGGLAIAGFAVATVGTVVAVVKAISAFERYEDAQRAIQATLKATSSASGLTGRAIEELSQDIARATLASVSEVRNAANVLLTFRAISGETFTRTLTLAQDMSQVFRQDLKQSVVQLGKALQDPITGLGALRRIGISFTETQKEMVKQFVKTGQSAKAMNLILAEVEKQVGGGGAAAAGGLAGAADSLAQSWENFLVSISKTGPIRAARDAVVSLLNAASKKFQPADTPKRVLEQVNAQIKGLEKANEAAALLREQRGGRTSTGDFKVKERNELIDSLKRQREVLMQVIDLNHAEVATLSVKAEAMKKADADIKKSIETAKDQLKLRKARQDQATEEAETERANREAASERAKQMIEDWKNQGKAIREELLTPTEKYNQQVQFLKDNQDRLGLSTTEVTKRIGQLKEQLNKTKPAYQNLQSFSSSAFSSIETGFTDMITGAKTWKESMLQIIQEVIRAFIRMLVVRTILQGFFGGFSLFGGGAGFNSATGAASGSTPGGSLIVGNSGILGGGVAKGAGFVGGTKRFAKGDLTSEIFTRPTNFAFGRGKRKQMGLMAEAGPEAVMPLSRGKDGKLGVASVSSSIGLQDGGILPKLEEILRGQQTAGLSGNEIGGGKRSSGGNDFSTTTQLFLDLRGSNGSKEIEAAVQRGIANAAPQLIGASVQRVQDQRKRNPRLFY